jgi:hypothetical protein
MLSTSYFKPIPLQLSSSTWILKAFINERPFGLYRPKRVLEQIKGISEQKATKILAEGE